MLAVMLKIIAGEHRSRILQGPPDESVSRPYSNRVKESVFDILRGWFEGVRVLDLYAGVGTVGLEAISRGAARVVMVEKNRDILHLLRQNIESLQCGDRATAIAADALSETAIAAAPVPVDLVFVDPPYEAMADDRSRQRVLAFLSRCRSIMNEKGFLILRTPDRPHDGNHDIAGFAGPEVHDYGRGSMFVLFYQPDASVSADESA
jgi:16S rRNA (guanine966-N2)-methyltransferase